MVLWIHRYIKCLHVRIHIRMDTCVFKCMCTYSNKYVAKTHLRYALARSTRSTHVHEFKRADERPLMRKTSVEVLLFIAQPQRLLPFEWSSVQDASSCRLWSSCFGCAACWHVSRALEACVAYCVVVWHGSRAAEVSGPLGEERLLVMTCTFLVHASRPPVSIHGIRT